MQKILVLSASSETSGSWYVSCVFWLTAPSNNKVPRPGFKSISYEVPTDVQQGLESGELVEKVVMSSSFAKNTTLAQVRSALELSYEEAQDELDATNPPVADLVGTSFDGTSWA